MIGFRSIAPEARPQGRRDHKLRRDHKRGEIARGSNHKRGEQSAARKTEQAGMRSSTGVAGVQEVQRKGGVRVTEQTSI